MTTGRHAFLACIIVVTILAGPLAPSIATSAAGPSRALPPAPTGLRPSRALPPAPTGFGWPVDPPITILRGFDLPPEPWLAGHRGVDLAARPGQAVRAAGSGVVTFAGSIAGRGVLVIGLTAAPDGYSSDLHEVPAGLRITYEPVRSRVHRGDRVHTGQVVGRLDEAHHHCGVLGSCLHWGLRRGDVYLDPLLLVRPRRIRLLPLDRELAPDPLLGSGIWSVPAVEPTRKRPTGPGPGSGSTPGPGLAPTGWAGPVLAGSGPAAMVGSQPGARTATLAMYVVNALTSLARAIVATGRLPP
ncbi:MAG TPA: M23 family metallopeptidase [Actinomycetes bacterium]|nr:M23 family metallopeptidase [Actinomycetes bacterium]